MALKQASPAVSGVNVTVSSQVDGPSCMCSFADFISHLELHQNGVGKQLEL
jgi:hypothetical protein